MIRNEPADQKSELGGENTMVLPQYGAGCVTDLLPSVLGRGSSDVLPASWGPKARVLLVLDGLGWLQLQQYKDLMPNLAAFLGGPITTVAPSTTASALTSITTSLSPGEHGIVGYRMLVDGQVFNSLRWSTANAKDCRRTIPPESIQPYPPFQGSEVCLVTKADFRSTGFSVAHLRGGNLIGYRTTSLLIHEVARMVREGETKVYAYYDGIDKVAHEYGLGSEYRSELAFVDYLVGEMLKALPSGTTVMVTADHGQLDCARNEIVIDPEVLELTAFMSGESRFRWLHAIPGKLDELYNRASQCYGHKSWVRTREQVLSEGWLGPTVSDEAESRLGDVVMLPSDDSYFVDPADTGPYELIGRHGSLTAAEMWVPCIAATV